jgi:hypothetical protein
VVVVAAVRGLVVELLVLVVLVVEVMLLHQRERATEPLAQRTLVVVVALERTVAAHNTQVALVVRA